jgi:glyoxylase-like metal-dependent hydrolase (beta-lactamase superfamily II)
MAQPKKIYKGVYLVGGSSLTSPGDCSFFAVEVGAGRIVLIDCGVGDGHSALSRNLRYIDYSLRDIDTLILTHCHIDHVGDANRIQKESGCRVVAHWGDSDAIEGRRPELIAASWYGVEYNPVKIDWVLRGDLAELKIGEIKFKCIHTPGHTPGSIAVLIDLEGKKILFGQDIHGPFEASWGSDMNQWRSSMNKLLGLKADILCEGHFGVFMGAEAVKMYIKSYLDRY